MHASTRLAGRAIMFLEEANGKKWLLREKSRKWMENVILVTILVQDFLKYYKSRLRKHKLLELFSFMMRFGSRKIFENKAIKLYLTRLLSIH